MTAPDSATDQREGYCDRCTDWLAWEALDTCSSCTATLCAEHRHPHDHGCPEDAP
jgi:hypothetical protein